MYVRTLLEQYSCDMKKKTWKLIIVSFLNDNKRQYLINVMENLHPENRTLHSFQPGTFVKHIHVNTILIAKEKGFELLMKLKEKKI